jgi:hypothetical protein
MLTYFPGAKRAEPPALLTPVLATHTGEAIEAEQVAHIHRPGPTFGIDKSRLV